MIEIVKSAEKAKGDVKAVLVNSLEAVEAGLEILDRDLMLDEDLTADFLAKDSAGKPVVILLSDPGGEGAVIHRLLLVLRKLRKNRFFLERIYREHLFDFSLPPRVFLLGPEMDDDFVACLDLVKAYEIVPCEYSFLDLEDRKYFAVTRKTREKSFRAARVDGGKAQAGAVTRKKEEEAPPLRSAPPKPAAPAAGTGASGASGKDGGGKAAAGGKETDAGPAGDFFQAAREKIKRITPKMTESRDGNLTRFKIDGKILTSLAVQNDVCYVFLGDKKDKAIKITSDKVLNETLNQVYKLYITQFGPAKTT